MRDLYRFRREFSRGRWSGGVDPSGLNLPQIHVHGEGDDYAYISIEYGSQGCDPVLRLSVDLEGTRLGRVVAEAGYRWRRWRWQLAREKCSDCGALLHDSDECSVSGLCLWCLNGAPPWTPVKDPSNPQPIAAETLHKTAPDRAVD